MSTTFKTAAILCTAIAFASLPGAGLSAPAAKPAATKGKPHPVQDVGPADLFHGYRCGGGDCLLHQRGYQWGADNKIVNPSDCRGTSEEFIEGCRAFAGIDGPLGARETFQDED
ncbi:MAG TPA: hypothetical protein VGI89_00040 [Rhizomicrobium sp.]